MRRLIPVVLAATLIPQTALAAPGLGQEVYPATVSAGETEFEARYDSLRGGPDNGEDVFKLEASHGFTSNLQLGLVAEFEREPGLPRKAEALGIEAIYHLGKVGGIDVAVYGEYELGLEGHSDAAETKLLLQRRKGPLDLRLNLIAKRALASGQKVALSYATSATYAVHEGVELGVEAFGDLGTFDHLLPRTEHFVGPVAKVEIEGLGPELELSAGYLFAVSAARDDTRGQLRLALELEL